MMKRCKQLLCNKKGEASYNYILLIVSLMLINLFYGTLENNLAILTVNEIRDVLESCAPNAIRAGIEEDSIKNETIVESYNVNRAIETFAEEVSKTLSGTSFASRIKTSSNSNISSRNAPSKREIYDKVVENTMVSVASGDWANTNNDRNVDVAVLTTVLPLEIKHSNPVSTGQRIEQSFSRIDANGNFISAGSDNSFNVSVDVGAHSVGVLIKFETRMILK